jgi:hypothetical protein
MTQINYPAKVLFKSATPVVTMIIGLAWFKKSYPVRDYAVVFLLIVGLYIFITGDVDATNSPAGTHLGIFYVSLSLFGSAAIPMIQEHCMVAYHASIEDMLYHCFLGSTLLSFGMSLATGEMTAGFMFLVRSGSVHAWVLMIALSMFGFAGTNFSAGLTLQYGSLVNGITNTFRKGVTLGLSFLLFPERNVLTNQKLIGACIFFGGLVVRIFSKSDAPKAVKKEKEKELYAHEPYLDVEADQQHDKKSPSAHTAYYSPHTHSTDSILTPQVHSPLSRGSSDDGGGIDVGTDVDALSPSSVALQAMRLGENCDDMMDIGGEIRGEFAKSKDKIVSVK